MRLLSKYIFIVVAIFAGTVFAGTVFAAGNIDSVQKYSQFLNTDLDNNSTEDFISWNLPTSNNGATVSDTTLSGYIWGEGVGWINLNPSYPLSSPGVRNSCTTGLLGGYAWGENTGWINFAPTFATGGNQPKINLTTGKITGTVWSQNYGWIQLSSPEAPAATSYNPSLGLVTTWRPSGACTPTGVNGVCGGSNGQTFSSAPSTGLCTDGTPSSVVSIGGGWIWSCNGTGGGTTASCSASTAGTCSGSGCVTGGSDKLTITKYVVGGTASATDFTINVKNTVTGVVISKQSAGSPGVEYGIGSGNYLVYENPAPGYTAQYGGDCAADGSVMVSAGSSKSCTVTNYFGNVPPPLYPPSNPPTTPPNNPSNPTTPSNPGWPSNFPTGTPLNPSTPPPVNGGPTGYPSEDVSPTNLAFGTSLSNVVASDWLKWILTALGLLGVASSLPGVISRIGNMVLTFVFGRKKWRGIVYDSELKEPLDPVYVTVIDAITGQEVASQFTDMEGRFGFVLKPGKYKIVTAKTNYAFPSVKLNGRYSDEIYDHLYYGEVFTVESSEQVVTMNIPMDPIAQDWNQLEKHRTRFLKYLIRGQTKYGWIWNISIIIGFLASIMITYFYPVWWNYVMTAMYVVVALFYVYGKGPISAGRITKGGVPLPYALVKIYNATLNHETAHTVTSETGHYYSLVPRAHYYITVEQKNPDGTYTQVFTSNTLRTSQDIINKSFDI